MKPATMVKEPRDLTPAEREWWRAWAPLAHEAGTLTERTAPTFRLLCTFQAQLLDYRAKVLEIGPTFVNKHGDIKVHGLVVECRNLAYRVEGLFARFGLAPTGRPVTTPTKKVGKWADFGVAS